MESWKPGDLEAWAFLGTFWNPPGRSQGASWVLSGNPLEALWEPSGGTLWEHSGRFLGAFWDPSGSLLVIGACLGPAWSLLGARLGPAWGVLGACLEPAWGLLGACLRPCSPTPRGREAPSGGRAPFGGKSPGWGLLGALGPAQGPLGMATPGGGQEVPAKPLGLGCLPLYAAHQVWLFVALPWQGWKRPSFTWAYA